MFNITEIYIQSPCNITEYYNFRKFRHNTNLAIFKFELQLYLAKICI